MTRMDATANEPNVFMRWHFFKTDRYLFNKFPIALFVIPTPPLSWVLFIPTVGNWEQKRGHGAAVPPMPLGSLFLTGKVGYGEYKKIIRFFAYPHAASPGHGGKIRPAPGRCMPGPLPKACPAHSAQRGNRRTGRAGGSLCAALGLWYEAGRAYPCSTFFTLKRPARAFCRWSAAGTEGAPVYAGP